jgi:hypothetical protein
MKRKSVKKETNASPFVYKYKDLTPFVKEQIDIEFPNLPEDYEVELPNKMEVLEKIMVDNYYKEYFSRDPEEFLTTIVIEDEYTRIFKGRACTKLCRNV